MDIDLNIPLSDLGEDVFSNGHGEEAKVEFGDNNVGEATTECGEEKGIDANTICLEIEKKLEIGSTIDSLEQAYLLYCEYARCVGFNVRKGDQTYVRGTMEIQSNDFNCSCEGLHDNKRIDNNRLPVYKKQNTRTKCTTKLRIGREKSNDSFVWKVRSFKKDHNHELVPIEQSYMLRSARQLTHANKSLLEALSSVGIGVSRSYRFFAAECGGPDNIGFTRKDAYNHLTKQKLKTSVENVDSSALVQLFVQKSNQEPYFYWNVQLDDDGRLMNFFFRDSRCLIDYEYFGDVLSVDTTYRTNKYDLICTPFIGMNHHRKNVIFGLAFLSNETNTSFEWLFSTFLESMHNKEPQVIFSDQCQALMHGIDITFKSASHRLCQWHISRNAPSHFGHLSYNKDFIKMWKHCMNGVETEDEFEACWKSMIDTYSLGQHTWFSKMYKLRKRWAAVFTNHIFSAGLLATSRSESTNSVLKELCSANISLSTFVERFNRVLNDWRGAENTDDFANIGIPGLYIDNSLILVQASKVLTRTIFKMFEKQLAIAVTVLIMQHPLCADDIDLQFKVASQPYMKRIRVVQINRVNANATCSCRMWETEGVICRHIFRIYIHMNVTQIPQHFFLHRWSKGAKLRHPIAYGGNVQWNGGQFIDDMAFVNYVTRLIVEVAQVAKGDVEEKKDVVDVVTKLKKRIFGKREQSRAPATNSMIKIRDPSPKKRAAPSTSTPRSHWN